MKWTTRSPRDPSIVSLRRGIPRPSRRRSYPSCTSPAVNRMATCEVSCKSLKCSSKWRKIAPADRSKGESPCVKANSGPSGRKSPEAPAITHSGVSSGSAIKSAGLVVLGTRLVDQNVHVLDSRWSYSSSYSTGSCARITHSARRAFTSQLTHEIWGDSEKAYQDTR